MKVYLASSWRNPAYEAVRGNLQAKGFEVYDFKNPDNQFYWFDISKDWECWDSADSISSLSEPVAKKAFYHDFKALKECDALVLLNPCGKSAHLEAGYAIGAGKPVYIWKDNGDPELMYLMATGIFSDFKVLVSELQRQRDVEASSKGES